MYQLKTSSGDAQKKIFKSNQLLTCGQEPTHCGKEYFNQ